MTEGCEVMSCLFLFSIIKHYICNSSFRSPLLKVITDQKVEQLSLVVSKVFLAGRGAILFFSHTHANWMVTLAMKMLNFLYSFSNLKIAKTQAQVAVSVEFLLQLSSVLQSLHIDQHSVHGIPRIANVNYFLGAYNVDWSTTIIKMLSRKLEKLYIANQDYPGYLKQSDVDILKNVRWLFQKCTNALSVKTFLVDYCRSWPILGRIFGCALHVVRKRPAMECFTTATGWKVECHLSTIL